MTPELRTLLHDYGMLYISQRTYMSNQLGIDALPSDDIIKIKEISLIRNCLMHNEGRVSSQLASTFPNLYSVNDALEFTIDSFELTINTLRRSMLSVDKELEKQA